MGQALAQMPQAMHLEVVAAGRRRGDHHAEGTYLHALAAGCTQLLIDHVHAGLGILGNGTGLAGLGTFAALDTNLRLYHTVLFHNTQGTLSPDEIPCRKRWSKPGRIPGRPYTGYLFSQRVSSLPVSFSLFCTFHYTSFRPKDQPNYLNFFWMNCQNAQILQRQHFKHRRQLS